MLRNRFLRLRSLIVILLVATVTTLCAQPPRGPQARSPQVHADGRVTFEYLAPEAETVLLDGGQFGARDLPMEMDTNGIWRVTYGPIKPDIYPYAFKVDGILVQDPANPAYFPNERFRGSLVDVPADTSLIHDLRDVPHGTVTYAYYPSLAGSTGRLLVYTPPGYDEDTGRRYPVYYLVSGTTDTEETWYKAGRANYILDNLIAEGRAEPMIVVMPYGNPAATVAEQQLAPKPDDPPRESEAAVARIDQFGEDLTENVIPYIDATYRTRTDRESRAIGGFSRGGGQTLQTAFGHPDTFAWVCSYSAYLDRGLMESRFSALTDDAAATNESLRLLWLSVGDEDFLYEDVQDFMASLDEHGVDYRKYISGGGHTWMNTKDYLARTAQLLFR
ncbi:MAG: alpha/beta hydrolase-fold protein [Lewinella sp.]